MALTQDQKNQIKAASMSVITSVSTMVAVATLSSLLEKIIVTNYEKRTLSSTKELSPNKDVTTLDTKNTSAMQSDAALSHDDVQTQSGNVSAAHTGAKAADVGTQASEVQTEAIATELGTMDTSSTALKLN